MKIAVTFSRHTITLIRTGVFILTLFGTTILPMFSDLPSVFAGTDTYPTSIAGCRYVSTGGSAGTCDLKDSAQDMYYDPWGEENRECTSYAAWMLHSVNGFEMPFYDSAYNWGPRAQALGYAVNMTPAVGSIYWTAGTGQYHTGQHVAWVESVSTDGSSVTIEDYNSGYNGLWAEHPGIATSSASGYIHFKDVTHPASWIPITGDWDGNGTVTIGLYDPNTGTFYLRNSNTTGSADITFIYGNPGWIPITGDWDGNGTTTVGVYNPSTATFFLRNSNTAGNADITLSYGNPGWIPLAGDWDGNGTTTIGAYNPSVATYFLRNSNTTGSADITAQFGNGGAGWIPLAGDWDGNRTTTIGVYNSSAASYFLRNSNTTGSADVTAQFGNGGAGWTPITGDWDGNGTTTIGVYNSSTAMFYLRNSNTTGSADITVQYGNPN